MDFAKDLKDSIDIIKNNGKLYSNIKSFLRLISLFVLGISLLKSEILSRENSLPEC